ncbi:GNAT family N-acetyltransferase [Streptomyces sp. NPDC058001]|uniref:GNAT family N-acetyltransferase n=1 Tax=Streptomyces sp. NPDC058001 TaxID=3346300 RepID=UPI0036E84E49
MDSETTPTVRLEPWSEGDFDLLVRNNAPEMTEHLGGPETEEQVAARHRRYLAMDGTGGRMFRIALGAADTEGGRAGTTDAVGAIGYWVREWGGLPAWETGWGVLTEFQGRGIAAAAARLIVERTRADGTRRHLHAFPSQDHPASNAVCRKAGFTLIGPCDFEYPKGHWLRSNDWRADLTQP